METWITATQAARLYAVSRGTIYAWASTDHWRRTPGRPVRYAWEDAQDSYEKRHGAVYVAQVTDQQAR